MCHQGLVAGIAMGLVKEAKVSSLLSDILGDERSPGRHGLPRLPVPPKGVTAPQMDIKIEGITEIVRIALKQARGARLHILKVMDEAIQAPRAEISDFARASTIKINPQEEDQGRHRWQGGSVIAP